MTVAEIHQRMAAIQARFQAPPPATASSVGVAPTSTPNGASPDAAPSTFATFFEQALSSPGAAGATGAGKIGVGGGAVRWGANLPAAAQPFLPMIEGAAQRAGLDPRLVAAVSWTESGFRPDATSSAGARGLMQLMPGTAAELGVDPADPTANLDGGTRYLAAQLERFGRVDHALAAYNAGPARVARAGGIPSISETQQYVQRVLSRFEQLRATSPIVP